jgi:hypothetical protein
MHVSEDKDPPSRPEQGGSGAQEFGFRGQQSGAEVRARLRPLRRCRIAVDRFAVRLRLVGT